jgi:hypothetical protein
MSSVIFFFRIIYCCMEFIDRICCFFSLPGFFVPNSDKHKLMNQDIPTQWRRTMNRYFTAEQREHIFHRESKFCTCTLVWQLTGCCIISGGQCFLRGRTTSMGMLTDLFTHFLHDKSAVLFSRQRRAPYFDLTKIPHIYRTSTYFLHNDKCATESVYITASE